MILNKLRMILLLAVCLTAYILFSSSSTGSSGNAINGCTCHGSKNLNSVITLSGIPATGYVLGATYNLTVTLTNPTLQKGGFNILTGFGEFEAIGTTSGVDVSSGKDEAFHNTPKNFTGNSVSWTFKWTAPNQATFNGFEVAANAVNGDNGTSGDQQNTRTFFVTAGPNSIQDLEQESFDFYPNPARSAITIKHKKGLQSDIVITSLIGQRVKTTHANSNDNVTLIDLQNLPSGMYVVSIGKAVKLLNKE